LIDATAYQSKGQSGGQPYPEVVRYGPGLEGRLAPNDEALVGAKALAAAKITSLGSTGAHHGVQAMVEAESDDAPSAEASIAEKDVAGF